MHIECVVSFRTGEDGGLGRERPGERDLKHEGIHDNPPFFVRSSEERACQLRAEFKEPGKLYAEKRIDWLRDRISCSTVATLNSIQVCENPTRPQQRSIAVGSSERN